MSLKEMLNKSFSDPKEITLQRYKSAKFVFIITTFLFFINFYFVGANFYTNIFSNTLGISYILLLLSIFFYIYFLVKMVFVDKPNAYFSTLSFVLLLLSFLILLLPLVFKG